MVTEQPEGALGRLAAATRQAADPVTGTCPPIGGCDFLQDVDQHELLLWGWFNPNGPTAASLSLVLVPDGHEALVYHQMGHPFSPRSEVWGIVRVDDGSVQTDLESTLAPHFATEGECLFGSLPSYVHRPSDSALDDGQARNLVRLAAKAVGHLGDEESLHSVADRLEHFRLDPWGEAFHMMDEFLDASDIPPALGLPARVPAIVERRPRPAGVSAFERWWAAVSDWDHVQAVWLSLPTAWTSSIRFVTNPGSAY